MIGSFNTFKVELALFASELSLRTRNKGCDGETTSFICERYIYHVSVSDFEFCAISFPLPTTSTLIHNESLIGANQMNQTEFSYGRQ